VPPRPSAVGLAFDAAAAAAAATVVVEAAAARL